MPNQSKVDGLLTELLQEEKRIRADLADLDTAAKELANELNRVQSAIKALEGKTTGGKKRGRRSSRKDAQEKEQSQGQGETQEQGESQEQEEKERSSEFA